MLGYELAKTLHFVSIIGYFLSLGFAFASVADQDRQWKKIVGVLPPVFGILILLSALGLVLSLELHKDFPKWGKIKIVCWLLMVILGKIAIKKKSSPTAPWLFGAVFILGCTVAYIAVVKPTF